MTMVGMAMKEAHNNRLEESNMKWNPRYPRQMPPTVSNMAIKRVSYNTPEESEVTEVY